jgi:hypothetical protein
VEGKQEEEEEEEEEESPVGGGKPTSVEWLSAITPLLHAAAVATSARAQRSARE